MAVAKRSPRYAVLAVVIGSLCAGMVVAPLAWRVFNRSSDGGLARPTMAVETPPNQDAVPDQVVWQPAVKPGPHPLLNTAEQAVWAEGEELRSMVGPKLQGIIRAMREASRGAGGLAPLKIDYPLDESVFPPEIVAPTFLWHESAPEADTWLIDVALPQSFHVYVVAAGRAPAAGEIDPNCINQDYGPYKPTPYQASARSWTPGTTLWAAMKQRSAETAATVTIFGFRSTEPHRVLSEGRMTFKTSKDLVGAPIFYRDVPLLPSRGEHGVIKPLAEGAIALITWRLRDISRDRSRVVLRDMPTCANCHSFSLDGKTLGMDVDGPTGDKGAYAIVPVAPQMRIGPEDVITWNSFADKPAGHKTIGFLSQISPDGQYAVTTVNESLYVANFMDRTFLQVFYPTRGILAYYSRATDEIKALPGADDPQYVHCDPVWSPDGRYLVFCRAKAQEPYPAGRAEPARANDPAELPLQYDLYRMPFNGGRGGECKPIRGASQNSMSNTFPKVSPDGKWIVFVQCKNGQLMRPDSRLWTIPAAGGEARQMRCNTGRMNSWHSFSPNGRWLVFSSKANTPFTQMFLTHLDDDGHDSPAVLIPHCTAANRAVNIPEFVNISADGLVNIATPAVEYFRDFNRAQELARTGRHAEAVAEFEKALAGEPDDWRIHAKMGESLAQLRQFLPAEMHFQKALEHNPNRAMLHNKMALVLVQTQQFQKALTHLDAAIRLDPKLALAWCNRGSLRKQMGDLAGALEDYNAAIRLDAESSAIWYNRGVLCKLLKDWAGAERDFSTCLQLIPPDSARRPQIEAELRRIRAEHGEAR
jgi:Flp pilus assembly protein TadD